MKQRLALVVALGVIAALSAGSPAAADGIRDDQWYLPYLKASEANVASRGDGVTVAIVDNGVDGSHADLAGRVLPPVHVNGSSGAALPGDPDGHGTALAGLIAGQGHGANHQSGVLGIAPAARILPIVMDEPTSDGQPSVRPDHLADGIDIAASQGAKVIVVGYSLAGSERLATAVRAALAADAIVIASDGNRKGEAFEPYPAAYDGVLAAVPLSRAGDVLVSSDSGRKFGFGVPGEEIMTTNTGGGYRVDAGSAAAGILAGAVALLRAAYPKLPASEIVHRMSATAVDGGGKGPDPSFGLGRLALLPALTADIPLLNPPPSPSPSSGAGPSTMPAPPGTPGRDTSNWIWVGAAGMVCALLLIEFVRRRRRRTSRAPALADPAAPEPPAVPADDSDDDAVETEPLPEPSAATGAVIGIDFGSSHTVAVLDARGRERRQLLFDGSPLLRSAVYVDADAVPHAGRAALFHAAVEPEQIELQPKRLIDDATVLVGAAELPVVDVLAAVLGAARDEGVRVGGALGGAVLTHPAGWSAPRRAVLREAAAKAGLPAPVLVPEPVAAAAYFVEALGHRIEPGGRIGIYDLGAGTFDTAVVTRAADGYEVLCVDGLPDVGGLDIDAAVFGELDRHCALGDPAAWRRLTHPGSVEERRARLRLWEDIRVAKELLSRQSTVTIHVPFLDIDHILGREELERLAKPLIERTVRCVEDMLAAANLTPAALSALFLVGGATRMPIVATLLHRRLGIAPEVIEQPELVVAAGALHLPAPTRLQLPEAKVT
jgi:hypothetical protein